MNDPSDVPRSRLRRLAKMVGVGARTGASLLLSKDGSAAAEHAAAVLGSLRGLAAKVGQMASYVDGFVPDEHRAAYAKAMGTLLAATPQSPPAEIRKLVAVELGAPVTELFATWSDEPFASASIGQVHHATLHDGRKVAVKVQHPGIAEAVESDLRNASVLETLVGALGPKALNTHDIFEVIARRFREELDYALEAERQEWFRALHADDPEMIIPEVVLDRSSRRVLTTTLAHGMSLAEAASGPLEQRERYAEILWRFVFRGNLVGGQFNADPHPGNYLFCHDGRVVFLDFGCVQPIVEPDLSTARAMHRAALSGDTDGFRQGSITMLNTDGGRYEDMVAAYVHRCFAPLLESPYRITPTYVAELVRGIQDLKKLAFSRDATFVALPPGLVFLNRLQFGFYSVLGQLDVAVDYAEQERRLLADAGLL